MRFISIILSVLFFIQVIPVLLLLFLLSWIPALKFWMYNLLLSVDQFGNTILLGSIEETISSRLGRAQLSKRAKWYAVIAQKKVDFIFGLFGQKDHCINAVKFGEDHSSELWSWMKEK